MPKLGDDWEVKAVVRSLETDVASLQKIVAGLAARVQVLAGGGNMAAQDIYGHWRRALTAAVLRVQDGAQSAAAEVQPITLPGERTAIIYVKVIAFSADKLLAEPDSGGLLVAL
jgi:hypothetical protein